MNPVRRMLGVASLLLFIVGGCGQDSVVGEWRNDQSVGPHGLNGWLTLQETGNVTYESNGSSGLAIATTFDGEWLPLAPVNGVPRYEILLGCRPPGTFDARGHCSSDAWERTICTLQDDRLSCPDAGLEGALRFLRDTATSAM